MRKLILFNMISMDGFFEGIDHSLEWHNVDEEFNVFAIEQLNSADMLLFGRKTYDLMAGYWPSLAATTDDPIVAIK
jgi:dihydrofolate reductase